MKLSAGIDGFNLKPSAQSENVQYLHPGQSLVTREPKRLTTILGSCVAVCLWDAATRVGGMNHFLLPEETNGSNGSDRYGNIAMESLIRGMRQHGIQASRLRAGIYGGAAVLQTLRETQFLTVGSRNVDVARDVLRKYGIPVAEEQTGGDVSFKIVFDTADGHIAVSRIRAAQ